MDKTAKKSSEIVYNTAKSWQIIMWPANTTVNNLMYILVIFLSYIAVGEYGLTVVIAGLIATYTRIFDGITDPIIAMITDRINPKFGKVRTILVIGLGVQSLSVLALFFFGVGKGLGIVYYTIIYIVYYIGATFASVTTNTGNTILTNDPQQRPKVFRWGMVYTTVIASFTSAFLSQVLWPRYGGLTTEALQALCLIVVGISLVLGVMAFIAISEKDIPENFPKKANGASVNVKDAFQLLRKNRGLQTLIVAGSSEKLTQQIASQSAIAVLVFGVIIGNYSFFGTYNMISIIPILFVIFYATKQAGKHGTKKALAIWAAISTGLALTTILFFVVIDPATISVEPVQTVIFIVLFLGFTAATRAAAVCTGALIPDVADYELYRSGNFMPGTVAAVYATVDKVISSFAATIVAVGISVVGYVEIQPQPNDPVTTGVFWMAMFLWMGLPAIGYFITWLMMKIYPLDKEMMHEVQQHIHDEKVRRKEKALEEATNLVK